MFVIQLEFIEHHGLSCVFSFFSFSVDAKISASLALSIHLNENCKKLLHLDPSQVTSHNNIQ